MEKQNKATSKLLKNFAGLKNKNGSRFLLLANGKSRVSDVPPKEQVT